MERVEQQLALHPDEVEHPRPVLGEERTGRGKILAVHHVDVFVGEKLVGAVPFGESGERFVDATLVATVPTVSGLSEFIGIAGTLDAVTDVRIGVVA